MRNYVLLFGLLLIASCDSVKNSQNQVIIEKKEFQKEDLKKYINSDGNCVIPNEFTLIHTRVFPFNSDVKRLVIPNSITWFFPGTFQWCVNLEEVTLPEKLEYISKFAFANCKKLKKIALPQNISEIELEAFENCESLESIKIPSNVKTIQKRAFYGCTNLKTVEFSNKIEDIDIDASVFENCPNVKLIIPAQLESKFKRIFGEKKLKICSYK